MERKENRIILQENDLVFCKLRESAIVPSKKNEDAGYDIYADFSDMVRYIPAHSTRLIPTGIAAAVSPKWYLNVAERGSTGSIGMKYSSGIIDSGYRGEIFIAITNTNNIPIMISKNAKKVEKYPSIIYYPYKKAIAQLLVHEVPEMNVHVIPKKEYFTIASERGNGCLGSTNA